MRRESLNPSHVFHAARKSLTAETFPRSLHRSVHPLCAITIKEVRRYCKRLSRDAGERGQQFVLSVRIVRVNDACSGVLCEDACSRDLKERRGNDDGRNAEGRTFKAGHATGGDSDVMVDHERDRITKVAVSKCTRREAHSLGRQARRPRGKGWRPSHARRAAPPPKGRRSP